MGASVPGKKREFFPYMSGIPAWHEACEEALEGWQGLDVMPIIASNLEDT